jgi:serine/threonine-protein kinase
MSSSDTVRQHLEKILSSSGFANAERLRRFLRFVVEKTLDGNAAQLKEYVLGVEVFDRRADYDPRLEPIVRVEARRLRAKLKKYYETEGLNDPIVIELPTGTYTPLIRAAGAAIQSQAPSPGEHESIALVPFVNRSPEPDNEYISEGLTEELIRALTKIRSLRVVAWPAAPGPVDVQQVAARLAVRCVLEGSVRRTGERLRVTVKLTRVATGQYLWSETFERELKDIFAVQDEIARAIARALQPYLGGEPGDLAQMERTRNFEAYSAYLKGRFHWSKRSVQGLEKAVHWFQQAVAADPDYSPAHAGVADAHAILGQYGFEAPAFHMRKAKEYAARALELDADSAEAYTTLGLVSAVYDFDWKHSEECFLRALDINPNYATARHWYGYDFLAPMSRMDEAVEQLRRAQQLDPLSPAISTALGTVLSWDRQFDRAIDEFYKALDLDRESYRAHLGLARVYADQSQYVDAIEVLDGMPENMRAYPMTRSVLAHALAASGNHGRAREVIGTLHEQSRQGHLSPFFFARAYAGFPDIDLALDWLEKAWHVRECRLVHVAIAPAFRPLFGHPRFEALLGELGLLGAYRKQFTVT